MAWIEQTAEQSWRVRYPRTAGGYGSESGFHTRRAAWSARHRRLARRGRASRSPRRSSSHQVLAQDALTFQESRSARRWNRCCPCRRRQHTRGLVHSTRSPHDRPASPLATHGPTRSTGLPRVIHSDRPRHDVGPPPDPPADRGRTWFAGRADVRWRCRPVDPRSRVRTNWACTGPDSRTVLADRFRVEVTGCERIRG